MRGSGTTVRLIDQSFRAVQLASLRVMVPMLLTKGAKYATVTRADFKAKVGYDLAYNNAYLGLETLLDSLDQVTLMRLNQNATFGHLAVLADGGTYTLPGDVTDLSQLEAVSVDLDEDFNVDKSSASSTLTITADPIEGSIVIKDGVTTIATQNPDGSFTKVGTPDWFASATIVGRVITVTHNEAVTGLLTVTVEYSTSSTLSLVVAQNTPGNQGKLAVKLLRETFSDVFLGTGNGAGTYTLTSSMGKALRLGDVKVIDDEGVVIATDSVSPGTLAPTASGVGLTGTVSVDGSFTLTFNPNTASSVFDVAYWGSKGRVITVEAVPSAWRYDIRLATVTEFDGSQVYTPLASYSLSRVPTDADFVGNPFSDHLQVKVVGTAGTVPQVVVGNATTWVRLSEGDNGDAPTANQLDFSDFPVELGIRIVCMNGSPECTSQATIISKFIQIMEGYMIPVFYNPPNITRFIDVKTWNRTVRRSEYSACVYRADTRRIGSMVYTLPPSVNLTLAYARMFQATGSLNFPPAGYDFGSQVVEQLSESDIEKYPAEAKLERINYLTIRGAGPVLWEHRSGYAQESDFSYLSTVFTYVDLASTVKRFMDNFNFKYITQELLLLIKSGLDSIGNRFLADGFLWSYSAEVPSFASVRASGGREMTIPIRVKFAEDGQEFEIQFVAEASA